MAGDAVAVLMGTNRAVAHVAAYYGYDVDKPDERLFALAVLGLGTATEVGKAAAYAEINKLVQALARRATWEQLRQNAVARVVEKAFADSASASPSASSDKLCPSSASCSAPE